MALTAACVLADNEKRLVKKCRELNSEIVGNAAKVQTALKLSEEDQQTIVALKKEIEKAWKMVDSSHEKVSSCIRSLRFACLQHSSADTAVTVNKAAAGLPAFWLVCSRACGVGQA